MSTALDVSENLQQCLEKYSDMVMRIAFQNLRCMEDAEDIAQEVFLKLITANPVFMSEEHKKAWFIRVTINRCRDCLRSAWFRRHTALRDDIPHRDARPDVLDAVMRLSVNYRNVIYLHYYEDMTVAQIAAALGQKENTVASWLFRARGRLRKSLEGGFDDE